MTPSRIGAIGAGLAPSRQARMIRHGERIHVVGAAGAGASAAALLAGFAEAEPSGCDSGGPSPYSVALEAAGIPIAWAHDPRHVTDGAGPDRLAVTKALTALAPAHPELQAAVARGIPVEAWQQVVADAAAGRRLIGVAGTHGKSTVAGWLVDVLTRSGLDPWAFVGALLPRELTGGPPATARRGGGHEAPFIVEADEYAGNFDPYRPAVAALTTVEWDHPDVFADRSAVGAAFESWIRAAGGWEQPAHLVVNVADPGASDVALALRDWPGRLTAVQLLDVPPSGHETARVLLDRVTDRYRSGVGTSEGLVGWVVAADREGQTIELVSSSQPVPRTVRISLAGRHNAANGLVVAATAQVVAGGDLVTALGPFTGIGRRLERRGEVGGVVLYDDYGHHPTAIRATLQALRQREPTRRVWAVYEPLTFHRTAAFLDDFAAALAEADAAVIADIWPGRDLDTSSVSATALAEAVARRRPGIPVAAPGSIEETAAWLAREVRAGDAVLVMGGGRSYRIADLLLEHLEA